MKSLIILLVGFFINSSSIIGQTDIEDVKQVFSSYRLLIENKEYDKAYDFYLDSFLVYFPKKDLKKKLDKLNNNDLIEYSVSNSKISFISEIVKSDFKKYVFITYSSKYNYRFKNNADKEYINKIKEMFHSLYGDNYSYNKMKKEITFNKKEELIAIKDKKWKFIIYKQKLNPYMFIWIPENIFSELLIKRKGINMLKIE